MGKFYRNLASNVNNAFTSDFYGRIANDAKIPSNDVQKYLLATINFAKGMQDDTNHYVTRDRLNNASFQQWLDPISTDICRHWNPVELVFEDIPIFKVQNLIVGFLLRELDIRKKDIVSDLIKKAPTPGVNLNIQKRLEGLQHDNSNSNKNNNNEGLPLVPPSSQHLIISFHHHLVLLHHCRHLL